MTKEELEKQTMEWKNNYILKLEKENAEMKKKYEKMFTIAHNRGMFVISAMRENRIFEEQLTTAKELLKQFLEAKNSEDTYKAEWEAEQFLKDSEGK